MSDEKTDAPNGLLRLALEMGPLLVFFVCNAKFGIYAATGAFMVAIVLSLGGSWLTERRLPVMAMVTAGFVLVFGGLTLWLQDELFIKLKPTIVNLLFAVLLWVGLATRRYFLQLVLGEVFQLTDTGWRGLTLRWIGFFCLLAVLNEIVWRSFSTDTWVSFKVFGIMPLTILFGLLQFSFVQKHQLAEPGEEN